MSKLLFSLSFFFYLLPGFSQLPDFVWAWNTKLSFVNSTSIDSSGNIYVAGIFFSTVDFDPNAGIYNMTSIGGSDIFVAKYNNLGNFLWAKQIGGTLDESFGEMFCDPLGNTFLSGYFYGTIDCDPSVAVLNLTSAGSADAFVVKLDNLGNLLFAKQFSGTEFVSARSIAIDNLGNSFISGSFRGTCDFNPSVAGTFNLTSAGESDGYIVKLDGGGNFVWAKQFTGLNIIIPETVKLDNNGNVCITGIYEGTADFNPSVLGVYNLTSIGGKDIFLTKLNSSGNFVWAKSFGSGSSFDLVNGLEINETSQLYLTGSFFSTMDADPGADTYNLTSNGLTDIFILQLNSLGDFVWAENIGGIESQSAKAMSMDNDGYLYITGEFSGVTDFDPGPDEFNLSPVGTTDLFTLRLDASGEFIWAFQTGGTISEFSKSIFIDASNNIYSSGEFSSTVDFDPGPGVYNLTSSGNGFITKLNQRTIPLPISLLSFSANCQGNNVELFWSTATETNNDHFTVERSSDGINFKAIGKIASKGNGTSTIDYVFTDENPSLNDNYYRLKQTDFDGKFTYSNVINTRCKNHENVFSVYPNPSIDGQINIFLSNDAVVTVTNALGKTIYMESFPLGQHTIHLSPNSGIYFINVLSGSRFLSKKIVIE